MDIRQVFIIKKLFFVKNSYMPELEKYNKKRDFNKTSEPKGRKIKSQKQLKYVIQHHFSRKEHYDLRLEWGGVFLSWAVPKGPSFNPVDKRLAIQVEDHPLDYGKFEGTIPKGEYGGGTVILWDVGTWLPLSDVKKGLEQGVLKFSILGERLKGSWALIKIKTEKDSHWVLVKEKDEYAQTKAGIYHFKTSIKTGRTKLEIEQNKDMIKNPFKKVEVQLVKLVEAEPKGNDWIYELKYDGYRIVAFVESDVKLMTRNHKDCTVYFKNVARSLLEISKEKSMVFDGEIIMVNEKGEIDFQLLQNHIKTPSLVSQFMLFLIC